MQQAWLMKAVVIELRVTSLNRQRSHTERLMSLLLDDSFHLQSATGNSVTNPPYSYSLIDALHLSVEESKHCEPFIAVCHIIQTHASSTAVLAGEPGLAIFPLTLPYFYILL